MIYGNITQMEDYAFLPEAWKACFAYAQEHDMASYEKGIHHIDGDRFFVNIVEYESTKKENRFWEAHKYYYDIHLVLEGEERIDVNFIENLQQKEFVEKDDFLPMEGEANGYVVLRKGDFLICDRKDAHMTAIQVEEPMHVKKAIFKVKIEDK